MHYPLPSLLLAVPFAASACVGGSGRAWVREAGDASSDADASAAELAPSFTSSTSELSPPDPLEDSAPPRPRLTHVVSLGASESASPGPAASAPAAAPAPGVVVNIVNYATTPYAGGYGYPLTYRTTGTTAAPIVRSSPASSGTPALGGDWRAAPSHGPSFPWHTGPASAWERPR